MKNEMQLKFLNKSENEILARTAVIGFLSYLNPTLAWMNELKTAVSEGVTNSIIHAYDTNDKYIELRVKIDDERVVIEIKDEGKGIKDINKAKKQNMQMLTNNERAGMGFQIMKAFTDNMIIESKYKNGTIVKLEKILEKGINI